MIRKWVYELVVLAPTDLDEAVCDSSLVELACEMDNGDLVGQLRLKSNDIVPPAQIREELVAVGNDGEFFSSD